MVKKRNFSVHHVQRTDSTQNEVRAAAVRGEPDGWCCLADEQTEGRGRLGRRWVAPPGSSLLASVLVRLPAESAQGLPFAGGLAAIDALQNAAAVNASLKWPNDVMAADRKLAGLLAEVVAGAASAEFTIALGIGLNLHVPSFPEGVPGISLHELTHDLPSRDHLLQSWLERLDARLDVLQSHGLRALLPEWRAAAVGLREPVTATTPDGTLSGTALDVDSDGALLVQTVEGVRRLIAGDVTLARQIS